MRKKMKMRGSSDEEGEDASQNDVNEAQEQCNHECIHTSVLVPKGCQSFWIKVSQNQYLSSSFFGFKPADLEELYNICRDKIRQHNWRGTKLKCKTRTKYNLYIIFLISFYWLKCYPTMKVLEGLTCINRQNLTRLIHCVLQGCQEALQHFISWPDEAAIKTFHRDFSPNLEPYFKNVVFAVDGTEIQVCRTWQKGPGMKINYSGKKRQYSRNVMMVMLDGRITYLSSHSHLLCDQSLWNALRLRSRFIGSHWGVLGDGGFYFNPANQIHQQEERINGYTPYKRGPENNYTLSPEQKAFNNHLSKVRVVVEDTISVMKKFSIMHGIYCHYSINKSRSCLPLDLVVQVISLLTNFHLGKSPIRGRNWKVDHRTVMQR